MSKDLLSREQVQELRQEENRPPVARLQVLTEITAARGFPSPRIEIGEGGGEWASPWSPHGYLELKQGDYTLGAMSFDKKVAKLRVVILIEEVK